jgi:hypothetical protein
LDGIGKWKKCIENLVRKPLAKQLPEIQRRWEHNIKMEIRKTGCE